MRRSNFGLPLSLCLLGTLAAPAFCLDLPTRSVTTPKPADLQRDFELLTAAANGDTKAVERALARGASIEARDGKYGFTPLMWASWRANLGTMRRLIERGANVNAKTEFASPQPIILREPQQVAQYSQQSLDNAPLVASIQVGYGTLNKGITPLLLAAVSNSRMALDLLLKHGARADVAAASGETPLDAAAAMGNLPAVQLLLDKGSALNSQDSTGTTPLISAIINGHTPVVRELLGRGADATSRWRGLTLVQTAHAFGFNDIERLLAKYAKQHPQPQVLKLKPAASAARSETRIIHANGSVEVVR